MFTASLQYATLSRQVARTLADQIRRGLVGPKLPGERWLAESLQVSRRTVRSALALLRDEGIVATVSGQATRVVRSPPAARNREVPRSVGLLLPAPVDQLEPYSTVFFDILRALLFANGYRLETHTGPSFFSRRPAAALSRLTARFPCAAWILAFSNRACQSWFFAQRLPAVIVGTAHEGIDLPYVDVDHRTAARHAARFLIGRGHRRLAVVVPEKNRAGDRLTEEGFLEGARVGPASEVATHVFRHDGTMGGLRRMTHRLLQLAERPTALFIANPYHYMGVAGLLAEQGVRVPRDLSLLCRDDDYCLRYLPVEPDRFHLSPEKRARAIFAILMHALQPDGAHGETRHTLLLPVLVAGASVARHPVRS